MRVLTPFSHGIIDYAVVVALLAAPTLFHFSLVPALIAYALGAIHLALSLCTRYPLGVFRRIPFGTRGVLQFLASLLLVALPWLAGFEQEAAARSVFIGLGLLLFAVWVITNYARHEKTMPVAPPPAR